MTGLSADSGRSGPEISIMQPARKTSRLAVGLRRCGGRYSICAGYGSKSVRPKEEWQLESCSLPYSTVLLNPTTHSVDSSWPGSRTQTGLFRIR